MSKVADLKKKLSAMKIRNAKTILLDIDYLTELVDEIEILESVSVRESNETDNNVPKIIHGGKF